MKKIYKYKLDEETHFQKMLPKTMGVVKVDYQDGEPHLWAIVYPEEEQVPYDVWCLGTGMIIPEERYQDQGAPKHIGTVFKDGEVWHYFVRQVRHGSGKPLYASDQPKQYISDGFDASQPPFREFAFILEHIMTVMREFTIDRDDYDFFERVINNLRDHGDTRKMSPDDQARFKLMVGWE